MWPDRLCQVVKDDRSYGARYASKSKRRTPAAKRSTCQRKNSFDRSHMKHDRAALPILKDSVSCDACLKYSKAL